MSVRSLWEDPHPGERFSIPFGASAWTEKDLHTINRKLMDGVAAKAECTRKNDQIEMVRRSPRMRRGNSFPKPLMVPSRVPEEMEAKSAPAVTERVCDVLSPSTSPSFPFPASNQPFEFDTDSETAVATETTTSETATTNDPELDPESDDVENPSIQQNCTDFSNFLGISLKTEPEMDVAPPVSAVDSDSFTRVNSVDDSYGWEAELDRKIKCEVASAQALCPYQCTRRTLGGKHSLLHRVFSMHSNRRINSRS